MLKWFILIVALLSDFLLLLALGIVFYYCGLVVGIVMTLLTYITWKDVGGISSWRILTIKSFLRNWDELSKNH